MYLNRMRTTCLLMIGLFLSSVSTTVGQMEDPTWPREIGTPNGVIVIYQPQIESFDGDRITARSAVAIEPNAGGEAVFGAMWFEARVATDREERLATFYDGTVTQAHFPYADQRQTNDLVQRVRNEMPYWDSTITLDRLIAALEVADLDQADGNIQYDNSPPKIIYTPYPAVLISIDGQPDISNIPGTNLAQIINTPFLILMDQQSRQYYLRGGDLWMTARDLGGPWQDANNPPRDVVEIGREMQVTMQDEEAQIGGARVPQIIVVTEPAELIASEGDANYSPIPGTQLLYMTNTDNDVIVDIQTQQKYVLLSGRWYRSNSLNGPWDYVNPDSLPADFDRIPSGAEIGRVLAHVPGTTQATDAWADTYIPQTAEIERDDVDLQVEYDGDPVWEPIGGTQLTYAANSPYDIVRYNNRYYCCNNAVWYVSSQPRGGWAVCDAVPDVIYTIPPTCPIYHVRYVRVYRHSPRAVIVGYTPGYTGCYRSRGVVVYGTGYRYRGWRKTVYYPRPRTFGFAAHYNRFTGSWGFDVGFFSGRQWLGFNVNNNRFARTGWHGGLYSGWWGRGGYTLARRRFVGRPMTYVSGRSRLSPNIYTRSYRTSSTIRSDRRHLSRIRNERSSKIADRRGSQAVRTGRKRDNNVFVDRSGKVYRHSMKQGWLERGKDGWREAIRDRINDRGDRGNVKRPTNVRDRDNDRDRTNRDRTDRDRSDRDRTDRDRADRDRNNVKRPTTNQPRTRTRTLEEERNARKRGSTRTREYKRYRERTKETSNDRANRKTRDDRDRKAREDRDRNRKKSDDRGKDRRDDDKKRKDRKKD